jgi:hypothetical protein
MRLPHLRVGLVERGEAVELALRVGDVLASCSTADEKPERCICTSWSISTAPVARMSPAKPRRRSVQAWLKARPSVNLGKSSSMDCTPSSATVSASASLARRSTEGCVPRPAYSCAVRIFSVRKVMRPPAR